MRPMVLDTNIVLDLFVFDDERVAGLKAALLAKELHWLATTDMRGELERVLGYAHIAAKLAVLGLAAARVLAQFDTHSIQAETAGHAGVACSDPDDQKFIDLAVAHRAILLSKDKAVLSLGRQLAPLGVELEYFRVGRQDPHPSPLPLAGEGAGLLRS